MSVHTSRATTPRVLMDKTPGSDAARRRFEDATTPDETEAVSAELIPMKGENLGDPIDYGAYLMGQLTGTQSDPADPLTYVGHDDAASAAGLQPRFRPRLRVPLLGLRPAPAEQARRHRIP